MPPNDPEGLVRGFFAEALNGHSLDSFDRFCGAEYLWHGTSDPEGLQISGLNAFKEAVRPFFEGFPDIEIHILDLVEAPDRVAVRFYETGTHAGVFMNVAPTGRRLRWDGLAIYRAADGKLVEEWSVGDNLSLLKQIGGVIPAPGASW